MFDKEEALQKFDDFLMIMDDQIDALESEASGKGIDLDFTLSSLPKLEELFTIMSEDADKETISRLVVYFARYLGEIVRKTYGGKWQLSLDDQKSVNFNTPIIANHTPIEGLEFSPIRTIRAFALKRQRGMLLRAIDAQVNPHPIDLSGLIEE